MPAATVPPPRITGGAPSPDLGFPAPLRDPAPAPTTTLRPATEVGTLLKSSEKDNTTDLKQSETASDSNAEASLDSNAEPEDHTPGLKQSEATHDCNTQPFFAVGALLKSSEEEHTPDVKRSEAAPDSERTSGSSEFFLRKPESSERRTPVAHEAFTTEQYYQMAAQVVVHLDLKHGKPPTKDKMILAFGDRVEGQVHAWEEVWSAFAVRWESQKAPLIGLDTPPSSSLIGSCIAEEDSEDTCVVKTISSEPHSNETNADSLKNDSGEEASGNLDYGGSATIEPVKLDLGCEAASYSNKADQILFDDGNNLKKNTTRSWQTFLKSHCCSVVAVQHSKICSGTGNIISSIQGWTEQEEPDWCVKCGKDGQLLNCYSCSLAAHLSCLGSLVRFSDSGNFCCPVCYHKAAAEEHEKSKKKYSEAKKNLYAFFGSNQFANQHGIHQSETANHCEDGDVGHQKRNDTADVGPEEVVTEKTATSGHNYGDGKAHEVGNNCSSHEAPHSKSQNGFSPVVNDSPSYRKVRFQEKVTSNSCRKASEHKNQYVQSPATKRCYPYPPECCNTPARNPIAPRRRSFVSTVRRAPLFWTGEEEAALREAVTRFAPQDKGNISWVQIRENGKDVFHPWRLPNDLRQKWNYMKKKDEIRKGPSFTGLDPRTLRASIPPTWMRDEARQDRGAFKI